MTESKTPIARESLEDSWESLSTTIFRIKSDRDNLLIALHDIFEYWNGNCNERAMTDALDHITNVAGAAIKKAERPAE